MQGQKKRAQESYTDSYDTGRKIHIGTSLCHLDDEITDQEIEDLHQEVKEYNAEPLHDVENM